MVQHARSRGFSGVNRDLEELLSRAVDGRFTHPAGWHLPPWVESGWVSFLAGWLLSTLAHINDSHEFLCDTKPAGLS